MYFLEKNKKRNCSKKAQQLLGIISYGRDGIEKNGTIITNNKNITLRVYVGCKNSDKIPVPRVVSMAKKPIIRGSHTLRQ